MSKKLPLGLALAVVVYVALRWLVLYSAFDQTALPMYELYPMGTLPKVLIERADIPLRLYYDNAAGQILTGLLAVPSYLAFGETYLALKLVPTAFGLGTVVLIYFLLREHFGKRAATLGALLFALGPATTVAKYSMIASGNHFENLFFTTAALYCSYRLHAGGNRRVWLPLAAFSAGFALFVFLGAIIPVGLLALYYLGVRGWRATLRDLRVALPCLLLGIAPLVALNLTTAGRGLDFLSRRFGEEADHSRSVLDRMAEFLFRELPRAGFFDSFLGMSKAVPNRVLLACLAIAWLAALPAAIAGVLALSRGALAAAPDREAERARFERGKLFPLVAYLPLTALAYGLSDLTLGNYTPPVECGGYRYYLPTFLFGTLLIAVFFERACARSSGARLVGNAVAGLTLLTGLWNLSYVDFSFSTPNLGAHYAGFNFVQAARGLSSQRNALSEDEIHRYADAFAPPYRHQLYAGLGFNRAAMQWIQRKKRGREATDFLELDEVVAGCADDVRSDMLRGAGTLTRFISLIDKRPTLVNDVLARLWPTHDPRVELFAEGASTPKEYPQVFQFTQKMLDEALETLRALPPEMQPAYARGCGLACGRLLRREIPAEERLVESFLRAAPVELSGELLHGLGFGLADGAERPALTAAARRIVPEKRMPELVEGYREGVAHVWGEEAARRMLADSPPG